MEHSVVGMYVICTQPLEAFFEWYVTDEGNVWKCVVVDFPTEPYHLQCIQQLAVQCKAQRCYKSQSSCLDWLW